MPGESTSPGPTAASVTDAQSKEIEGKYSELGLEFLDLGGRFRTYQLDRSSPESLLPELEALKKDVDKWSSKGPSSIPESAWQAIQADLTQVTNDVKASVKEFNRIEAEEQGTKDQDPPQDAPGPSQA